MIRRCVGLPLVALGCSLATFGGALALAAPQPREATQEGFLRVQAPKVVRHGVPWIGVRTRRPPESFSARLNGRDISDALLRLDGKPRTATLSPSEGLQRGRNRLTIVAGHNGVVDRDRVVIRVRSRVLPAAGGDREVRPGKPVRLDGTKSIPGAGRRLSYRWRIVEEPRGSKARLQGADTGRPRLLTDRRGIYRLDLQVRRPGGRAAARASDQPRRPVATRDKLVVEATKTPPIGLPISTLVQEDGVYGISVGGIVHKSTDPTNSSVQILRFQASTLELQANETVSIGVPAEEMSAALCSLQGVYAIQVPPGISEQFAAEYRSSGQGERGVNCLPFVSLGSYQDGISVIGSGNWNTTNWSGQMTGYLQSEAAETNVPKNGTPVISHWYRYVPGQFVSYDTQAPNPPANGNTIQVGAPNEVVDDAVVNFTDTKQLPTGASGFHALALNAQTMQPLGSAAFATNGGPNDSQGIAELAQWLGVYQGQPFETRVILQSIGAPEAKVTPNAQAWGEAGEAIVAFGGNPHVFNTIKGSYAFFGGTQMGPDAIADGVDVSESVTGKPASLGGVLSRDRRYDFSPSLTDPGGNMDTRLMPIAFQPPQEWPHPDGSKGEQAAASWIMEKRLYPTELSTVEELRAQYWDDGLFVKGITGLNGDLECSAVPAAEELTREGFTREDFEQVCRELRLEFEWVGRVAGLLGTHENISYGEAQEALVGIASTEITHDIETNIVKQIEDVKPPENDEALELTGEILGLVSDIAWVGEELFPVESGINPAGLFSSLMGVCAEIGTTVEGEVTANPIREDANRVVAEFLDNTATTAMQFSKVTEILVSDYGKLKAVGELLGPDGPEAWEWKASVAENSFTEGSVRWAYRELLPAKYSAVVLEPFRQKDGHLLDPPNTKPTDYVCPIGAEELEIENPFQHAPEQSYFGYYATPVTPAYWIALLDASEFPPSPPSSDLAVALQASPITLYLPWLFEELPQKTFDCQE